MFANFILVFLWVYVCICSPFYIVEIKIKIMNHSLWAFSLPEKKSRVESEESGTGKQSAGRIERRRHTLQIPRADMQYVECVREPVNDRW